MSDASYTDSYGNIVRPGDLVVLATASGRLKLGKVTRVVLSDQPGYDRVFWRSPQSHFTRGDEGRWTETYLLGPERQIEHRRTALYVSKVPEWARCLLTDWPEG